MADESLADTVHCGALEVRAKAAGQSLFYADIADDLDRLAARMRRRQARETQAGVVGRWRRRPNREWTAALRMARRWLEET
jgi:hypothetical protein